MRHIACSGVLVFVTCFLVTHSAHADGVPGEWQGIASAGAMMVKGQDAMGTSERISLHAAAVRDGWILGGLLEFGNAKGVDFELDGYVSALGPTVGYERCGDQLCLRGEVALMWTQYHALQRDRLGDGQTVSFFTPRVTLTAVWRVSSTFSLVVDGGILRESHGDAEAYAATFGASLEARF